MATIQFRWEGNGLARITAAAETLAGPKKNVALRRAINHTGRKVFTRVKRELARQINTSQAMLIKYGKLRAVAASNGRLEYLIIASGGPIPLKHLRAYQTAKGVSADPWKNRKIYRSAFVVASMGGHVFWRKGRSACLSSVSPARTCRKNW